MKRLLYFLVLVAMLTLMGIFFYTKSPALMRLIDGVGLAGFLAFLINGLLPRTYDGVIFASNVEDSDKIRWELQLNYDPEILSDQSEVIFKIVEKGGLDGE